MELFRASPLLPRPATGSGFQCLSHLLQMKGRVGRRPNRQTALVPSTSLSKVAASKAMETVEKEEDEKFQTVVLSLIARYSRYSWLTWIVVKIILKVTTYTVLKVIISFSTRPDQSFSGR